MADEDKYTELSQLIVAAQDQIKKKWKPIKEVWLDPNSFGLGFGKLDGKWKILLGCPDNCDALEECPMVEKVQYASQIPLLCEAIVMSKGEFIVKVEQATADLLKFLEE